MFEICLIDEENDKKLLYMFDCNCFFCFFFNGFVDYVKIIVCVIVSFLCFRVG